jgi:lipopolysaccharide/colanic/teichoic acid biosynthesis glycosyltransferase
MAVERLAASTSPAPQLGRPHVGYAALKRAMDVGASVLTLTLGAPLFLAIAIAIRIDSHGPIIYRSRRIGRDHRPIDVLKFRSMREGSQEALASLLESSERADEFARAFKLKDDPRLTRVGRFLRHTSLDELPQFWNVLGGDMSLVGPRPIVQEELSFYGAQPLGQEAYLGVRPGITGLWQVSGRSDLAYEDRVRLDIEYVTSRSLLNDLRVLARTPRAVVTGHGAY